MSGLACARLTPRQPDMAQVLCHGVHQDILTPTVLQGLVEQSDMGQDPVRGGVPQPLQEPFFVSQPSLSNVHVLVGSSFTSPGQRASVRATSANRGQGAGLRG